MAPKVILVTGASSGFGRSLVEEILVQGDIAVAALRTVSAVSDISSKYGKDRLLVIQLDITVEKQRVAAFDEITKTYGHLDVVINNAGVVGAIGEFEGHCSNERSRGVFETNFWATLEMTRLAVEYLREVNKPQGGRVLVISSFVGYANFPGCAIYNASKAALESAIASFQPELDPAWGIKVVLVNPGHFGTNSMVTSGIDPIHPAYEQNLELPANALRSIIHTFTPDAGSSSAKAAKVMLKIVHMDASKLPTRVPVGSDAIKLITGGCNTVIEQMEAGAALAAEADGRD